MGINAGIYAQRDRGDKRWSMITRQDLIDKLETFVGHKQRVIQLNKIDSGTPVWIAGHYGPIKFARAIEVWGEDAQ